MFSVTTLGRTNFVTHTHRWQHHLLFRFLCRDIAGPGKYMFAQTHTHTHTCRVWVWCAMMATAECKWHLENLFEWRDVCVGVCVLCGCTRVSYCIKVQNLLDSFTLCATLRPLLVGFAILCESFMSFDPIVGVVRSCRTFKLISKLV